MSAQGTATVNLGAYPGLADVSLAVTGQSSIQSSSLVEAWLFPTSTSDHSADEHFVDPPFVTAGNVIAGTGFTIYLRSPQGQPNYYGAWTVGWVWS